MVECPKCGFVQPEDRFCANCGIDMLSYKPQNPPLLKRIVTDPGVQLVGVVLLVAIMITSLYLGQKEEVDSRMQAMQSPVQDSTNTKESSETPSTSSNTSKSPTSPAVPPPSASPTVETQAAMRANSAPSAPVESENAKPKVAPDRTEEAEKSAAESTLPQRLSIRFAELPRSFLYQLFNEAHVITEGSQIKVVSFKMTEPADTLRNRDPGVNFLRGGKPVTSLAKDKPISLEWLYQAEGSTDEFGLSLQVRPIEVTAQSIELSIEGFYHLKMPDPNPPVYQTIRSRFTFPVQETLMIAGIIPHTPLSEDMVPHFTNSPLAIMTSPDFLENQTEFAIFIQSM